MSNKTEIVKIFGNKIRVRACGICINDAELLLVKHSDLGNEGYLWAPPGGGVSFGESIEDCLVREVLEETGLRIKVLDFLFVYEFIVNPLHAIELFFNIQIVGGEMKKGSDPELVNKQIIQEVRFCDQKFIDQQPKKALHGAITLSGNIINLKRLSGYIKS